MTEYRSLGDDEILQKGDVYEHSDGTIVPVAREAIGCRASFSMYNRWKRKIEPTPVTLSEVESGLKAIDNRLEEVNKILQEMATLLNRIAPQGSERERIALQLYVHVPMLNRGESFERADGWIAERDRQRAGERVER